MASGKTTTTSTGTTTTKVKPSIQLLTLETTGSVKEDEIYSTSGSLKATSSDPLGAVAWSIKGKAIGSYGTLSMAADGSWKYELNNAASSVQSLTSADSRFDTFSVQALDNFGNSVSQSISIKVAGTNEKPVITATAGQYLGTVAEDGISKASGQLSASSVEKGASLTWSAANGGQGIYGTLTIDKTGGWIYQLDNAKPSVQAMLSGESVTDSIQVSVSDGSGQASSAQVTISIAGSNDAPSVIVEAGQDQGSVAEDGDLTASGDLSAESPDHGAVVAFSTIKADGKGDYGYLTIDSAGTWTYALDNADAVVQALASGETLTDTIDVQATDEKGMSTKQSIVITIHGSDEPTGSTTTEPAIVDTGSGGANSGGVNSGKSIPTEAVVTVDATNAYTVYSGPVTPVSNYTGANPFTALTSQSAVLGEIGTALFANTSGISVDAGSFQVVSGAQSVMHYDGNLPLGIGAGLLLTSGGMPGTVNSAQWYSVDNAMAGDADLNQIVQTVFPTTGYDATTINFSFTVTDPTLTGIRFNAVFGSDEYPEWVDTIFVDIAAVIVNGQNVALFDPANSQTPLSIIGSNLSSNYFINNSDGHLPIEYDGITNVLDIFAPVHLGVNTIKIGISDTGDHIYDSGLFISNLTGTTYNASGVYLDHSGTEQAETQSGGAEAEVYDAKGGDDVVFALEGNDVVLGGAGNDRIDGGGGADVLQGGSGADVFVYERVGESSPGSKDTIADFSSAEGDLIDLSAIDANTATPENDAFVWTSSFDGHAAQLKVTTSGNGWLIEGDVDGDAVADIAIIVVGTTMLQVADLVL